MIMREQDMRESESNLLKFGRLRLKANEIRDKKKTCFSHNFFCLYITENSL